jgi:isopropylmalate/homocitrate/citramalate synthase
LEDDKEVAKELVKMRRKTKTKVFFLCRWHKEEVDFALETGADGVIFEGTSDPWFANVALNGITADQMYKMFVETTAHAKKNGLFTTVMPWDTARAPLASSSASSKGSSMKGAPTTSSSPTLMVRASPGRLPISSAK